MAVSGQQVIRLLDRLIEKTALSQIAWERSLSGSSYQTRFDDFIVMIENNGLGLLGGFQFTVKKLDGSILVTSSTGVIINTGNSIPAIGQVLSKMERLFELIDNTSDDFEKLMRLI